MHSSTIQPFNASAQILAPRLRRAEHLTAEHKSQVKELLQENGNGGKRGVVVTVRVVCVFVVIVIDVVVKVVFVTVRVVVLVTFAQAEVHCFSFAL